jgi:DNA-binding response OmpR family regulator
MFPQAILLEDEPNLAKAIEIALKSLNISVLHFLTLKSAFDFVAKKNFTEIPQLALVDRTLPDGDGVQFIKTLRESGYTGAILILSARNQTMDKIVGLNEGADDYLAKPFDFGELEARIRVLSRRMKVPQALWNQNANERKILGPKGWVSLTPMEYKFCETLLNNPKVLFSRDDLLKNVWGYQFLPKTRTVDFFWGRIRKSFELDPENPVHFLTVRGAGYRFEP